jgi:hypothetical protein
LTSKSLSSLTQSSHSPCTISHIPSSMIWSTSSFRFHNVINRIFIRGSGTSSDGCNKKRSIQPIIKGYLASETTSSSRRFPKTILSLLASSFSKCPCPVLELLQAFFADAGSDIDETSLKVTRSNWADLIHGHVEKCLSQASKGSHSSVFGQSCDIAAGESYEDISCEDFEDAEGSYRQSI